MENQKQPQFSRMSLNALMLVCIILIIILAGPGTGPDQLELPDAPKINVNVWQSDSGARVWYSAHLSNSIELQLWYQAGFRYDGQQKGSANLLAQLLKYESKQLALPVKVALDQDFIKIALSLSSDPLVLKKQISSISKLIYHPRLSNNWLTQLRNGQQSLTDQLRMQAYGDHPYAGPKQGSPGSLHNITRSQIQSFHHLYLHPKRLFVSIVGDISEQTTQVIIETLLPASKHAKAKELLVNSHVSEQANTSNISVLVQPGIENFKIAQPKTLLANHYLISQVLNQQQPNQVKYQLGQLNNTFYIQGLAQVRKLLKQIEQGEFDWDMMLRAKRQLASKWLRQVQDAQKLSRYLVHLNAYDLPIDHMANNLTDLQEIDMDSWQQVSSQLLVALNN